MAEWITYYYPKKYFVQTDDFSFFVRFTTGNYTTHNYFLYLTYWNNRGTVKYRKRLGIFKPYTYSDLPPNSEDSFRIDSKAINIFPSASELNAAGWTDLNTKSIPFCIEVDFTSYDSSTQSYITADTLELIHKTFSDPLYVYLYDYTEMTFTGVTASDVAYYNSTTALARYGNPVKDRSSVRLTPTVVADSRDPSVTFATTIDLTLPDGTQQQYTSTNTNSVTIGTPTQSGDYHAVYRITNSRGGDITQETTFTVLDYSPPRLESVITTDADGTSITPEFISRYKYLETYSLYDFDELGTNLWCNFSPKVHKFDSATNPWRIRLGSTAIKTGDDGGTLEAVVKDRDIITETVATGETRTFTLSIKDWFDSYVSYTVVVPKAEAYFDIEPYGVAVGKLSEGTEANPLFECAYPAIFADGLSDTDGNVLGAGATYVAEETEIGSFLGKKLYRIVYVRNSAITTSTSAQTISLSSMISGTIDTVISVRGAVHLTGSGLVGWLPLNTYHNANVRSFARFNSDKALVCYCAAANNKSVFIIEYTKS